MRIRCHTLPLAIAWILAWTATAQAREDRVVAIGGHELTVALADGDCFFDPDRPGDQRLIDQLSGGIGPRSILLLAFANCRTMGGWRAGVPATLPRFGYLSIAETHLEPVFAFDQATLADAISKALVDLKTPDYRADITRLAGDLEQIWPGLPSGGQQELGIAHRDRFGPILATVLKVAGPGGRPTPRVMLQQSILVAGKVLGIAVARDYVNTDTVFDVYGDLSAMVEATAARN